MVPPAQEKSETQQPPSQPEGSRIQEGACLPVDQIKLYVTAKDGSKSEVSMSPAWLIGWRREQQHQEAHHPRPSPASSAHLRPRPLPRQARRRHRHPGGLHARCVTERTTATSVDCLTGCLPCVATVCSSRHVPGYVEKGAAIKGKGVDEVYCIAGNDAFVMEAWAKSFGSDAPIRFLADQDHSFAGATGLGCELFGAQRLKRFSMLVEDGVVKSVNVEKETNNLGVSSADHMLEKVLGGQ